MDGLTHDLEFCKNVKEKGLSIKLHGSIRPYHISDRLIDENDFRAEDNIEIKRWPRTLVFGSVDRAGIPCDGIKEYDLNKIKEIMKEGKHEMYVVLGKDAVGKEGWLKAAILQQATSGAGMVAFNDSYAMYEARWLKEINYNIHNAEQLAKKTFRFTTAKKAIIIRAYH